MERAENIFDASVIVAGGFILAFLISICIAWYGGRTKK